MRNVRNEQIRRWAGIVAKDFAGRIKNRGRWYGDEAREAIISDLTVDLFSGLDDDTLAELPCSVIVKVRSVAFYLVGLNEEIPEDV